MKNEENVISCLYPWTYF